MQFRCFELVWIGPPRQKLRTNLIFGRFLHCNCNIKVTDGTKLWVYNAKSCFVGFSNIASHLIKGREEKNGLPGRHQKTRIHCSTNKRCPQCDAWPAPQQQIACLAIVQTTLTQTKTPFSLEKSKLLFAFSVIITSATNILSFAINKQFIEIY